MISDEDLSIISESKDFYMGAHLGDMARELLALRKASYCPHQWKDLKLVECGGSYQYRILCTLCGAKKVAE